MDDFSSLEKICPYCDEIGTVVNPKFISWDLNGRIGEPPEAIINCPICNGTRIIPTKLGNGILDLVDAYSNGEV